MPCSDITEVIVIELDAADTLRSYRLNKRTCGAEIGQESLIVALLAGRSVDAILALPDTVLRDHFPDMVEEEEFLYFKHLFAVQEALRVLVGDTVGAPGEACTAAAIAMDPEGLRFEGLVSVEALTDKIKACGNCGSCGSRKKARAKTPEKASDVPM